MTITEKILKGVIGHDYNATHPAIDMDYEDVERCMKEAAWEAWKEAIDFFCVDVQDDDETAKEIFEQWYSKQIENENI